MTVDELIAALQALSAQRHGRLSVEHSLTARDDSEFYSSIDRVELRPDDCYPDRQVVHLS